MKLDDLVLCTYTYFTTPETRQRPSGHRVRFLTHDGDRTPSGQTARENRKRKKRCAAALSTAQTQRFQRVMDAQALAQRTLRPLSVGRAVGCPAEGAVKERAVSVRAVGKAAVEWVRGA